MDDLNDITKGNHKDHESRIRILENFRWWVLGGVLGSAALSSVVTRLMR
jgi:hypothetical protein